MATQPLLDGFGVRESPRPGGGSGYEKDHLLSRILPLALLLEATLHNILCPRTVSSLRGSFASKGHTLGARPSDYGPICHWLSGNSSHDTSLSPRLLP